jgi:hypothetical protein
LIVVIINAPDKDRAAYLGVVAGLLPGSAQTHQHCVEYANDADQRCDDVDIQAANWNGKQ